jgi:N-glycosylase/DNA lyase
MIYSSPCGFFESLFPNHVVLIQVATQYLLPELAGKSLTPKLSIVVADAFVAKFGKYAGWAQTVLFIGQLPAQKLLAAKVTSDVTKATKRKRGAKIVEIQT